MRSTQPVPAGSQHGPQHDSQRNSHHASASSRRNKPSGCRGSQHGFHHGSAASNTPSQRVRTEFYQIGDMTRTYIEGMVPEDQERGDKKTGTACYEWLRERILGLL